MRFVRSKATDWHVDPDKIVASGYSAGAIAALFMAYAEPAQYEGESNDLFDYPSNPNGVLSFAGQLN